MTAMNPWHAFHMGERGFYHIEKGTVCQDASWSDCNAERSLIIVADGHGSRQYCRSNQGSQFAVQCAAEVIDEFLVEQQADNLLQDEKQCADTLYKLCSCIVAKWHAIVKEDVAVKPFTEEELADIPQSYVVDYLAGNRIEKAYGTTLIAVFTVGERCFGIHLGDGKCVAVYEDGCTDEPIPWDENCCFNVTTSLCDTEALGEFRFAEIRQPVAVFIGTDGIDDTYGTRLHWFYLNILQRMIAEGCEETIAFLRGYLYTISEKGSHDDVSLAGIVRPALLPALEGPIAQAQQRSAMELELQKLTLSLQDLEFSVNKEAKVCTQLQEESTNAELQDKLRVAGERLVAAQAEFDAVQDRIAQLQAALRPPAEVADLSDGTASPAQEQNDDSWDAWENPEEETETAETPEISESPDTPETGDEHNGSTGIDSEMPEE